MMIRHGYSTCAQCHVDSSGGGLLTQYGRAQGEILLATQWGEKNEEWEPGRTTEFLFGAVSLPSWLDLGISSRSAQYALQSGQAGPWNTRFIQMQADLRGHLRVGRVRTYGSVAVMPQGALAASITSRPDNNLVSREHWVGVDLTDQVLLRVGRVALPFGIRKIEHSLWARSSTKTDLNTGQQHGVGIAYSGQLFRGELFGIAGNLQVSPDEFRERGYSGYLEAALTPTLAVGMSSLVAHAELDVNLLKERMRQAHGAFVRWVPAERWVLMFEADTLVDQIEKGPWVFGSTGFLQADFELIQGIHLMGTGEWLDAGGDGLDVWTSEWISLVWFFAPRVDVRLDFLKAQLETPGGPMSATALVGQFHFYL